MDEQPPATASLPSIRRFLLSRIVGIVAFSFILFCLAAWLIVLRPAQDELSRVEMGRAAGQVDGDIRALTDQIERILVTARDWGRNGQIQLREANDLASLMIPVLRSRPQISTVLVGNDRGQAVLFGRGEGDGWLLRVIDYDKLGAQQHWTRLNAEGGFVGEEWVKRDYDPRTRPWYQGPAALAGDDAIHWTEPYLFFTSKEPGISAGMRWTDRNTGLRHVVAFDVLLLDLSRYTSRVAVGANGRAAIFTHDGRLLGLPRHPLIRTDEDLKQRILKAPREAGMLMLAGAHEQWVADGRPAARAAFFAAGGETWIGRFRPFALRNQQLLIGTVAPRADFTLGTAWDAAAIGSMMALVVLLAFLIGRRFSRRFGAIIDSLVAESERLGALQLEAPVRIAAGTREIAKLVDAQERMRLMLIDATHGLERKVKKRTRELAEREAFANTLMESSPAGLVLATREGQVRHLSGSATALTGYTLEDMQAISSAALYADVEARARLIEALDRDGRVRNFETRIRRKDGSEFWGMLNSSYVEINRERLLASWIDDVSEPREAAERIRALAVEQEMLLENVQVGILFTGDAKMLRVNAKFAELFGYDSAAQVAGLDTKTLFPNEAEFGRFAAQAGPVLAAGKSFETEWTGVRRDGSTFLGHTIARAIQAPGYRFATIWIISDITERKAAEDALRVAHGEMDAIFKSASVGIALTRAGRVERSNARADEMFGCEAGGLLGVTVQLLFSTTGENTVPGALARLARGETHRREKLLKRMDGSTFWCRFAGRAVDTQDPSRGNVWMLEDISEEHAAAEALRAANDEQSAIFESATSGIALIRDRRIERCNGKLEEIFGYAKGEFLGKPTRIWYASDDDHQRGGEAVYAQIARGETHRREQQLQRKDGSRFWCRLSGHAVDTADASKGSVWMLEDVTDERAAAEALREAKRIAEDATQAKSMFLANMSHEIRTPMNAIIGMSHLALKTELSAKQRDYVAKIHNAGTSLLGIINDILDFSKVEAGKLEIEVADFRLDEVLDNVSSLVAQKAYDKGLELLFDTAPGVPQALRGDALRLGQVLVNLVNNAVKFTERGQISVAVRSLARTGDKLQLQVSVRDSGIGMTPEQAGRLFQAFSQADGSTTRKYGGTGLGLAICKRLVELMGGEIRVDSAPGEGSCFSFTAWLDLGDERLAQRRLLPEELNAMRVLVVDDNAAAREILSEQLRGLGFSVSAVASGADALAAVAQAETDHPFGVVFVDWKMPGMDGIETARRLREGKRALRIVMATAFGRDDARAQAQAAGIESFLVKPISQSSLVDSLVDLFAPQAGASARAGGAAIEAARLGGVRLLLAEDNEINQQIAVELLQGAGASVAIANNGREAMEMLAAGGPEAYDAVLMDLQMPEMDGIEATRRLRADARFAGLPIIAMTAHAMVEERERCLAAGMADHISKPIDPHAMFQTLARWVRGRTPPAAGTAPAAPRAAALLQGVEGLDSAAGLKRVAGNHALYLSLLRQFAAKQADAGARVAAALAGKDRETAERIAHTVKGVAGNVGLAGLAADAAALEHAIRAKKDVKAATGRFEASLAHACAALQDALADAAPAAADAPAVAPAESAAHAERLAALLAASDGEAADYLLSHGAAIRPLFADGNHAAFERAVQDFDFEGALRLLERAAAGHGIAVKGESA